MSDISFDSNGRAIFPTKHHGEFSLSKRKWDTICQEPERSYYRHNGEKVATTLINPDHVRHSATYPNQLIYYKLFDKIRLNDNTEISTNNRNKYWAVIVDESTTHICTVYPTKKPKPGKEYQVKK